MACFHDVSRDSVDLRPMHMCSTWFFMQAKRAVAVAEGEERRMEQEAAAIAEHALQFRRSSSSAPHPPPPPRGSCPASIQTRHSCALRASICTTRTADRIYSWPAHIYTPYQLHDAATEWLASRAWPPCRWQ